MGIEVSVVVRFVKFSQGCKFFTLNFLGRNERFQENQVLSAVMDLLGGGYNNEGYPRAHCGKLCDWNIGDMVELSGQLFRRNNRFAEIRDKTGVVQLIVDEEKVVRNAHKCSN